MSHYSGHKFNLDTDNDSWSHLYQLIDPHTRLLDVGCANGNFGAALKETKSCEVIGIDIDRDDLALAKKQLDAVFLLDITKDEISHLGMFDYILFADVIEHLVDPRSVLQRIKPLLKKNGKILFSIPNMAHVSVRIDLLEGNFPYKDRGLLDKTHLHFYESREVDSVFEDSGYTIVHMHPTVVMPTLKTIKLRLEESGLKALPKFHDTLLKTKGDIFQFVGYAEPLSKYVTSVKKREYIMPHDELRRRIDDLEHENERLAEENNRIKLHANTVTKKVLIKKLIDKNLKIIE